MNDAIKCKTNRSYAGVDPENVKRVGVSVSFVSIEIASSQLTRLLRRDLLTGRSAVGSDERQRNAIEAAESARSHSGCAGRCIL